MALFQTFKIIAGTILSGIIRSSAIFVYISEAKVRLGAIQSWIIRSSAIFVYIREVKVRLGAHRLP